MYETQCLGRKGVPGCEQPNSVAEFYIHNSNLNISSKSVVLTAVTLCVFCTFV
jgi:hypothetical protein